jgi:NAD(P)-dependent dehydrogenase (short-subunit alcohol dehydrogenase family)
MSSTQHDSRGRPRALVTGATAGMGRAIALQLGSDGFEVIVHGRDAGRGQQVVGQIESAGGAALFAAADLTDPSAITRLAAAAGEVEVLVNNAGFSWFGPTAELSPERFDALFASNVRAPYLLVAALAPGMAARGSGSIINVSSMAGRIGLPAAAAYGATKGALESMTRAWAAEFSPAGVRVNAIAPGPVYTDGAASERTTALGATTPMGRAAQPDDITGLVSFLASAKSGYVTGAVLAADGGRSAI